MGEYAEMMLDGTLCSSCGEFLGTDAGYPVQCLSCEADTFDKPLPASLRPKRKASHTPPPKAKPCVCGDCGKEFPSKGARKKHRAAVHLPKGATTSH